MPIALGLLAALAYGSSDFLAGLLSRRTHYAFIALIANLVALVATLGALLLTAPSAPTTHALLWGTASGIGSAFGTLMLFRGLGRGRMGVVAPLSALGTAALPVLVGVALGDRPSVPAWFGIGLTLPAILLVSTAGEPEMAQTGVSGGHATLVSGAAEGLLAGVGFALLLVGLDLAGDASGLWPVVAAQGSGTLLLLVVVAGTARALAMTVDGDGPLSSREASGAALVGAISAVAAISYFLSAQAGLLSIVAVLTSLYPAVTVLLARVVLREPISPAHAAGLALAGSAVVLIIVG